MTVIPVPDHSGTCNHLSGKADDHTTFQLIDGPICCEAQSHQSPGGAIRTLSIQYQSMEKKTTQRQDSHHVTPSLHPPSSLCVAVKLQIMVQAQENIQSTVRAQGPAFNSQSMEFCCPMNDEMDSTASPQVHLHGISLLLPA